MRKRSVQDRREVKGVGKKKRRNRRSKKKETASGKKQSLTKEEVKFDKLMKKFLKNQDRIRFS